MKGTFRSAKCLRSADAGTFANDICSACNGIPLLPSFKKRFLLRTEKTTEGSNRNTSRIRNDFLTPMEMKQKLEEQKRRLDFKDSQLFFEKSKNLRLRIRQRSLREQLTEYARRGSLKAVCHDQEKASEKGLLEDKRTLNGLVESVACNFHVMKNGRRYSCSLKLFMEVLLMWGGPRIATFVASNLCGPEIHSIYRWRNQHRVSLADGIVQSNFKILGTINKEAMSNIQVKNVPVLAAEDETAIVLQYVRDCIIIY